MTNLSEPNKTLTDVSQPAWHWLINNPAASIDSHSVAQTLLAVYRVLVHEGPEALDLSLVSKESPSLVHVVAFLQGTYLFRFQIKGWSQLLSQTQALAQEHPSSSPFLEALKLLSKASLKIESLPGWDKSFD